MDFDIGSLKVVDALCEGSTADKTHEQRLLDCLDLGRSNRMAPGGERPIAVNVTIPSFTLLDYNDLENTIEVQLSTRYRWKDPHYKWEPEHFGGIKYLVLPAYTVWKPVPSIVMNRNKERQYMETMKTRVWFDGFVEWFLFIHTTSICMTDFSDFPYDTQLCELKIYHFPYSTSDLNVTIEDVFEVEVLSASWRERDAFVAHETYVNALPDGRIEEHVTFSFTFVLDRKVIFFNYLIVCPSICVQIFILLLFMVPNQSNQRFTMASFLFMSTISLYLSTQHMLPPGVGKVPFIVRYITFDFVLLLLVFIISIVSYHMYHHDGRLQPSPVLKQIFLNRILRKIANVPFPLNRSTENLHPEISGTVNSKEISTREQLDKTLGDLQNYLASVIAIRNSPVKSTFEALVGNEWRQMALVLERLCLIIFSLLSIVITSIMFSNKFSLPKEEERFL